jgi:hypothetical protein
VQDLELLRLPLALALSGMLAGCGNPDEPCEPWAKVGDAFTVTVGKQVAWNGTGRFGADAASCGEDFDLSEGDTFHIEPTGRNNEEEEDVGCYFLNATVSALPNVEIVEDLTARGGWRVTPVVASVLDVVVADDCSGTYWIDVDAMGDGTLYTYRAFSTDSENADACGFSAELEPGGRISCYDAWFSRVEDSNGNVLKDSIPED